MSIVCITAEEKSFTILPKAGQTLAQAIWLSGTVKASALCSGLGHCGHCRVRFLSPAPAPLAEETTILGQDAVDQGWRLACRRLAKDTPQCRLALPSSPKEHTKIYYTTQGSDHLLLAVDLGTTSLHWSALTKDGQSIAQGKELNPQMGAGADVMSRLTFASTPEGRSCLANLVRSKLAEIIARLPNQVDEVCLAANTAMTDIFLVRDITGLCAAPYSLSHKGHCRICQLPIDTQQHDHSKNLPPIYIPPLFAPFVGGDISAGVLALLEKKDTPYPFLLADMGTNGEFALALSPQQILVTSVPLGPSLEGIGLRLGDMAGPETATAFQLRPNGLAAITPSGLTAQRICGTGYLSLLSLLLNLGLLDRNGHFLHNPSSPLARKLCLGLDREHNVFHCSPTLYLTAEDVEEILKVKAAFSFAVEKILHAAQIRSIDLQAFFLAGALGEHVAPPDLEMLGFIQPGQISRLHIAGNTALRGAELLLLQTNLREKLAFLQKHCITLSLTEDTTFTHNYLRHMRF